MPQMSRKTTQMNSQNDHYQDSLFPEPDQKGGQDRREDGALRPKLERASRNGAVRKNAPQGESPVRFLVRVTSVRRRLIDEDNLSEKYVVDCCRYAGLLPSDDPGKTKIETSQRKPEKGEEEHTLIEIYPATAFRAGCKLYETGPEA